MSDLIGKYVLRKEDSFRAGNCVFTVPAGGEIEVVRVDENHHKVLVRFGSTAIDWFDVSILKGFDKL